MKIDPTVRRETGYIAVCVAVLSALMEAVFLIIGQWDYTVLLGNLLSGAAAIGNFFLMGLTVQKAVGKEEKQAAGYMKLSQMLRMLMLFVAAALGVALPCFNTWTALIPLFFPRIAITLQPFIRKERVQRGKSDLDFGERRR